jgi:FOG: WD40 repeat
MVGKATKYTLEREVILEGRIVSLDLSPDGTELLAGSATGKIFKSLTSDLSSTINSEGHVEHISQVAFKKDKVDIFATIDHAGQIIVWDLNTLNVITRCTSGTINKAKGMSVCIADDDTIVSGWDDGFIRCFEVSDKKYSAMKWEIVNAHRGAVTCVYAVKEF